MEQCKNDLILNDSIETIMVAVTIPMLIKSTKYMLCNNKVHHYSTGEYNVHEIKLNYTMDAAISVKHMVVGYNLYCPHTGLD